MRRVKVVFFIGAFVLVIVLLFINAHLFLNNILKSYYRKFCLESTYEFICTSNVRF